MSTNKIAFILVLIFAVQHFSFSQNNTADSLLSVIDRTTNDTSRINKVIAFSDAQFRSRPQVVDSLLDETFPLIKRNNDHLIQRYFHYKCISYIQMGKADSAMVYGQKYLTKTSTSDEKGMLRGYSNIGIAHEMMGDYEGASMNYEKALEIAKASNDTLGMSIVHSNLGLVYDAQGNLEKAMDLFLAAMKGFKQMNHVVGQSSMISNFTKVAASNGDYELAISYLLNGLHLDIETDNKSGYAIKLNNLGECYAQLNQPDSAVVYFEKALEVLREIKSDRGIAITLSNIAKSYNASNDHAKALSTATEAIKLAKNAVDTRTQSLAYIEAGKANQAFNNYGAAKGHYLAALDVSKATGEIGPLKEVYYALYQIEKNTNPKRALSYYEQSNLYKDSLLNRKNIEELTSMKMKYEFQEQELKSAQEVSLLQTKQQLTQLELDSAVKRNIGFGIGLGLLSLFAFTFYRQRNNIREKNDTIARALDEKETLLKEIHHRVKNNLQVISALLTLQANHIKDDEAKEALQEGQDRVASMALIHKDLYQHDNLKGVNTKDYLEQLTNSLIDSYKLDQNVELKTDIEEIWLDVDTMIPMGLMVNELISNALKHAFVEVDKGQLLITLKEEDEALILRVADDGSGVKDIGEMQSKSFGYSLIKSFSRRLNAEIDIKQLDGLDVTLVIQEYQKVG